jgi:hypothetical protein
VAGLAPPPRSAEELEGLVLCTLGEFRALKAWKQRQLLQTAGLGRYTTAELLEALPDTEVAVVEEAAALMAAKKKAGPPLPLAPPPHGKNRKAVKAAAHELHTASRQDNCEFIVGWLRDVHPDFCLAVLEYGGVDGWTALHFASRHGHPRAVALLLEAGASTAAKDDYGNTPSHYAQVYADSDRNAAAHREVLQLLGVTLAPPPPAPPPLAPPPLAPPPPLTGDALQDELGSEAGVALYEKLRGYRYCHAEVEWFQSCFPTPEAFVAQLSREGRQAVVSLMRTSHVAAAPWKALQEHLPNEAGGLRDELDAAHKLNEIDRGPMDRAKLRLLRESRKRDPGMKPLQRLRLVEDAYNQTPEANCDHIIDGTPEIGPPSGMPPVCIKCGVWVSPHTRTR